MCLLLGDLISFMFNLCLFISPLRTCLVQLSLAILLALLQFSESLCLNLFFLLNAQSLSDLRLLALILLTLVLRNLVVECFLSLTRCLLLAKGRRVRELDFFLHDRDAVSFGYCGCIVLTLVLLDVR